VQRDFIVLPVCKCERLYRLTTPGVAAARDAASRGCVVPLVQDRFMNTLDLHAFDLSDHGLTESVDAPRDSVTTKNRKPSHYKIMCISMYTRDIADLEAKVAELKRRGWTTANKSQLLRLALSRLDLDDLLPVE
jgi:hypothetical protein